MPLQSNVSDRRPLDVWTVRILFACAALALVLVTPSLALDASVSKTFVLAFGAVITLAAYIVTRLSRGTIVVPPMALVGALWLPVVAYALSATFSGGSFANGLWGTALEPDTLGFMIAVATIGSLTALVLRRVEEYQSFTKVAAIIFVGVTFVQTAIVLLGQVVPNTINPGFSLLGSYQDLANFLGLGIVATLVAFRLTDIPRRSQRILTAALVLALLIVAIANSTLVWTLIALVSLAFFIEAVMMRKGAVDDAEFTNVTLLTEETVAQDTGHRSIGLNLSVLAVAVFFLIGSNISAVLANSLKINALSVSLSWSSTIDVARHTIQSSPLFGSGPSTFGAQWMKYRDPALNTTQFWTAQFGYGIGFIPTSIVTTGILGIIAWLGLITLFVMSGVRVLIRQTPKDPYVRFVSIMSFVSALYLLALMIFTVPMSGLIALAFVVTGLFASTTRFATLARQRGIIFSQSPRLGFVVVFALTLSLFGSVVMAYSLMGRYIALLDVAKANAAFDAADLSEASRYAQTALGLAPLAPAYQTQAGIALVQLQQIAASTTMPATQAQQAFQTALTAGIDAALTATRVAGNDYRNWLLLGNLYAKAVPLNVDKAYDSAKMAYEKARDLNPTSAPIHLSLAQLDIAHNDLKSAREHLKKAIELKQDYLNAIFLLSQVEVQDGNLKGALDSARAAAYFAPKDPNVLFQLGVLAAAGGDLESAKNVLLAAIDVSPQFANARYVLAAVLAKQGNLTAATEQVQAIADLSPDSAARVAPMLSQLKAKKNPFPANLLTIPSSPVQK